MSCVREASPPLQDADHPRHDTKKKRFLPPWRNIRKIFRRKDRPVVADGGVDAVTATLRSSNDNFESCQQLDATNLEPAKSHSTSHLTDDTTDNSQRRSLQSTLLSVSHDSVFASDQRSADSGSETSLYTPLRLGFPNSIVRAELEEAIKKRRVYHASDDEDLGLPRSPVSNSPTTADDMFTKEHIVTKSSQSTCSDGSLLSMGSSEIDEETYCHSSRNSSKHSLYEKRISSGSDLLSINDKSSSANASLTSNSGTSLSHSAAKHKMAVKPKRNHGAPHKKRQIITSNTLPTTPEVNEENSHKVLPPEEKSSVVADTGQSDEHDATENHAFRSQHTRAAVVEHHTSITQINATPVACSTPHSKCSSLPPGVSLSPVPSFKLLTRSKSNVVAPPANESANDLVDETVASAEKDQKKDDNGSFFSRLLLRRSSKKKKNAAEEADWTNLKVESETHNWKVTSSENISFREGNPQTAYVNGLNNAMKHHPLFRQRIEPLNLPNIEPPSVTADRTHTSTVPINMGDGEMKTTVKKSHSFRNHEKLPYSCYEDTPSLPVNIGLVEEETVTQRFSKNLHKNRLPEPFKYSYPLTQDGAKSIDNPAPEYEAVGLKVDTKWKPAVPAKLADYSNISVVNGNKVNISLGESTKNEKSNDVKVPVPTPRTSLLNKSADTSDSASISSKEEDEKEVPEVPFNIIVTESSGQRSIVSIGSIEMNSEPGSPLVDSVFEPLDFNERQEEPEKMVEELRPVSQVENPEVTEDMKNKPVRPKSSSTSTKSEPPARPKTPQSPMSNEPSIRPKTPQTPVNNEPPIWPKTPQTSVCNEASIRPKTPQTPVNSETPIWPKTPQTPVNNEPATRPKTPQTPVNSEPATRPKTPQTPMNTEPPARPKTPQTPVPEIDDYPSIEIVDEPKPDDEPVPKMEKNEKPVHTVVADFANGIVKVNDTTVMLRRKSKDVSQSRDDEPELMKVFARRSLKLKETDNLDEMIDNVVKSRDSDKENEDSNSPPEERKKNEIKIDAPKSAFKQFQRSFSHDVEMNKSTVLTSNGNEKRQRCKSTSHEKDLMTAKPPPPSIISNGDEKPDKMEIKSENIEEKANTPFKRIQQRREEWEKRAQQAMKVRGNK